MERRGRVRQLRGLAMEFRELSTDEMERNKINTPENVWVFDKTK